MLRPAKRANPLAPKSPMLRPAMLNLMRQLSKHGGKDLRFVPNQKPRDFKLLISKLESFVFLEEKRIFEMEKALLSNKGKIYGLRQSNYMRYISTARSL